MRSISDFNIVRMMFVVPAVWIALNGQHVFATDHMGALDAQVSLATKTTFVQGEPIILRYSTVNVSDQKIGVDWGQTAGCTLSLTDQAGITTVVQQQGVPAKGFHLVADPFVPVGGKRETYFTVPQRVIGLHPGRYTLSVRVQLPYTVAESNEENPLVIEKKIKASGNVFSRTFRFPLTVTAPNDSLLRATAASLVKTILTPPSGPEAQADMEALFSMPEAQAEPSWRELVAHSNPMNAALIADKLGNVDSVKAANLLLEMRDNPSLSPESSAFVSEKLAQMYNSGSVALRSHLKNTMAQRGISLPDKIAVSQPTD